MAILYKCKMCGGTLELHNNETVATCEYCGTQQTLPRLDNDRRANLYDRANHFRRNNDFDKAMGIYEQILNDDTTDAEAYWSIVLCRYGIEYVEDPATHKRVPTVNRAQFTSIFDDDNYKSALQYADGSQRSIYEEEAQAINEIQKGILAISQKEEPFDVFICYKETDNNGRRTPDSVLANDLYHQLTLEGFKVFFSRITLEDKLGVAYEPYIFAALNSAKVMVVLGTKPEHFNAVWVKNEWSRYLSLIKNGAKKILIPAYKDMDPYDLPEEFSHLQAQDMSKLGFMQDLIRGIKKLTGTEPLNVNKKETVVVQQSAAVPAGNIGALLERGKMALEDSDWKKADGFFEEVLNQDAKDADAYLGKALAAERCATLAGFVQEHLDETEYAEYQVFPITTDPERAKAAIEQYAIPEYLSAATIDGFYAQKPAFSDCVADRKAQRRDEEQYWAEHKQLSRALRFATADSADGIKDVYTTLLKKMDERIAEAEKESIANKTKVEKDYARFLDEADAKVQREYKAAVWRREKDYQNCCLMMETDSDASGYEHIAQEFGKLLDYKDSKERAQLCTDKAAAWRTEQKALAERQAAVARAKTTKNVIIATIAAATLITAVLLTVKVIIPNKKYNDAIKLMETGNNDTAVKVFTELGDYKDSQEKAIEAKYQSALALFNAKDYAAAAPALGSLGDYKDSKSLSLQSWDALRVHRTIAADGIVLAVKEDGTVMAKGESYFGEANVYSWRDIIEVDTNGWYSIGLRADGTAIAAGEGSNSSRKVSNWSNLIAVSAGRDHTVGLKADGTVVAVGDNEYGKCDVYNWSDIVAISAGEYFTLGLKIDGSIISTSSNHASSMKNTIAIATDGYNCFSLKSDGTVVNFHSFNALNSEKFARIEEWSDVSAIFAGTGCVVALKTDGTVVAAGKNEYGECNVQRWRNIVAVAAGRDYTVGLKADGTVVATGTDYSGKRNVESWEGIRCPREVNPNE